MATRLNNTNKAARQINADLEARFLDGEHLTVEQIMKEYLSGDTNLLNYIRSRDTVKSWLHRFKGKFKRLHGRWFGCLNDLGEYGLCNTEAEYRYVLSRYMVLVKGTVARGTQVYKEGAERKMLGPTKQTTFLLDEPVENDK